MNTNFGIFRGHSLPVDPNTSTAANNTYDKGSAEYYWRTAYVGTVDLKSSTTTGSAIQVTADTAITAGAMKISIGGTERLRVTTEHTHQFFAVTSASAAYSATAYDYLIEMDVSASATTCTIPAAAAGNKGKIYEIRKTDTSLNAITLATGISTTINTQNESVLIRSNGSAWAVVERVIPSITTAYTPTFVGFGTAANVSCFWKRVGDCLVVTIFFTTGTVTAVTATISLPSGLAIDTGKLTSGTTKCGRMNGVTTTSFTTILVDTGSTTVVMFSNEANGANFTAGTGSSSFQNTTNQTGQFMVPISGWSG